MIIHHDSSALEGARGVRWMPRPAHPITLPHGAHLVLGVACPSNSRCRRHRSSLGRPRTD